MPSPRLPAEYPLRDEAVHKMDDGRNYSFG